MASSRRLLDFLLLDFLLFIFNGCVIAITNSFLYVELYFCPMLISQDLWVSVYSVGNQIFQFQRCSNTIITSYCSHTCTYLKFNETLYGNLPKSGLNETRVATLIEFPMAAYVTWEMAFTFLVENTGVVLQPQMLPACQRKVSVECRSLHHY